jgi:DNA-binding beta-propeller fold protein YncE
MIRTSSPCPTVFTLILALLLAAPVCAAAEGEIIPFDEQHWDLTGAQVVEHLGRTALAGSAVLKDVEFLDGVVEFEMALDGSRDYPGLSFRRQSPGDYEHFYIRPHNSTKPEALQYAPVWGGVSCWQLYHEGYIAAAEIPAGRWVPVRLEIKGTQMRVFFDNMEQPALVVTHLQRDPAAGGLALNGSPGPATRFSNFRLDPDAELHFDPAPEPVAPLGLITQWELSQKFLSSQLDRENYPDAETLAKIQWQPVIAEPNGLVNISRHVARSPNREIDAVFARATITAEEDGLRQLAFGYSDAVNIFLNGEVLFTGSAAYRQRNPSYQGIIGLHDAVYLPLKKGDNELMMMVVETFGGWGVMAQDSDMVFRAEGVTEQWELSRHFKTPESVVYDSKRDVLYVSNFYSGGNEFISRVSPAGTVLDLQWVSGLARPTGMAVRVDSLFVVDRSGLVEISIDTAQVVNRFPVPGGQFLNDVAFDGEGRAYVSDSRTSTIHRMTEGTFEAWLSGPEISDPNGLCFDGERLIVGNSGDGSLKAVDLEDKSVSRLASLGDGSIMDGIACDGAGGYIVSDFNGRVFRVSARGKTTEILNRTAPGLFCADLAFVPEKGLLVIPSLYDNRVTAYRVE